MKELDVERILLERDQSPYVEKQHGVINYTLNKANHVWILKELGFNNHTIVGGNYFTTPNPFHVHTDNGKDNQPHFNIVIPLNEQADFHTVVFDQTYGGWASHFWVGSLYKYVPSPVYNAPKRDWEGVYNLSEIPLSIELYIQHLSHLPYESVEPLSVKEIHTWKAGHPFTFECDRLHCSSNFKGIKEGLTLLVKNLS